MCWNHSSLSKNTCEDRSLVNVLMEAANPQQLNQDIVTVIRQHPALIFVTVLQISLEPYFLQ